MTRSLPQPSPLPRTLHNNGRTLQHRAIRALLIVAAVIAATLLWGVGEVHYRNCIQVAQVVADSDDPLDIKDPDIDGCSRLPF